MKQFSSGTIAFIAAASSLIAPALGQSTAIPAPPTPAPPVPAPQPADAPKPEAPKPAAPKLGIGDAAPVLIIAKWIKGAPIDAFAPGKTYVVEFWSPTSPPSRLSAPVLSDLQAIYKDKGVVVVGISVVESRSAPDLDAYVRATGESMAFTIALDSSNQTARAYMQPSGQDGIPVAYIVDGQGKIEWIGHPLDGLDRALEQVVGGTYDAEKAKFDAGRRFAARQKSEPLVVALEEQFAARETDKALATMDTLAAIDPPFTADWAVQKFAFLLLEKKDADMAYAYAVAASEGVLKDRAEALKSIAWMTLAEPGVARRDVPLALRLARRADDLTNHIDPNILDTLARAQFDSGDADGTRTTQARAVELCKLPTLRKELRQRQQEYAAAKK